MAGAREHERGPSSASAGEPPFDPRRPPWEPPPPPLPSPWPAPPAPPPPSPGVPTWYERDAGWADDRLLDRLIEQRTVMLGGHLDDALANRVVAQLLLLDAPDGSPIRLHLGCPDGDLDAALAVADTIAALSTPVHVTARGAVGGPAVAVLCAATDRVASHHCLVVLSLPRDTAVGTAAELAVRAEQRQRQVDHLRDLVAGVTGRPPSDVEEDLRRGRVLSAEDAVEYGLVTRLL